MGNVLLHFRKEIWLCYPNSKLKEDFLDTY